MLLARDHPTVRLAMGHYLYHGFLEYDRALEHFAVARQATPNDADLVSYIAYVYRRQGKYLRSVAELEVATELDPRNWELANNLASSYMLLRNYEKAESLYDRAIGLAPEIAECHSYKARTALFGEGNPEKARAVLNEGLRVVSDKGDLLLTLIMLLVFLDIFINTIQVFGCSLISWKDLFYFVKLIL